MTSTRPIIYPEKYDKDFCLSVLPEGYEFVENVITDPKILAVKESGYYYIHSMTAKKELRAFYIP